jgi:hypothetical protein
VVETALVVDVVTKYSWLVFYSPESWERLANAQTFFIFMDGTHLNSYTPSGFHSKM